MHHGQDKLETIIIPVSMVKLQRCHFSRGKPGEEKVRIETLKPEPE
ncbi:hypothetical protein [Cupriavidus sp. UME77]|nr:hypothetical protein [Cupriavidus sp. UME77]